MGRHLVFLALVAAFLAVGGSGAAVAGDVGKSKLVHDGAGDALRVTIVKTQQFKAYSSFAPDPGMKWWGAFVLVHNVSEHARQRCIPDWLKLRHGGEVIFEANDSPELTCPTTAPGKTSRGWIVWSVRKSVNPSILDWIVDSSFVHEKISWKLH